MIIAIRHSAKFWCLIMLVIEVICHARDHPKRRRGFAFYPEKFCGDAYGTGASEQVQKIPYLRVWSSNNTINTDVLL